MNQAVVPGSPRWIELVTQGIIKTADRNWFLGKAALEIAPMGDNGVNNGTEASLQQYADEIGVEYASLQIYRKVAASWPPVTRVTGTPWKVHHMLMGRKDLIRPGMTVTQAALVLGQKNTGRTGPRADVEARVAATRDYLASPDIPIGQKAEIARELLTDPEVADAAFNRTDHQEKGSATQTALGNISQARIRGEQRRAQERIDAMPPAARDTNQKIGQSGAKIDLEDAVTRYRGEARRFTETVAAALPKAGTYGGYAGPLSLAENVTRARDIHQQAGNTLDALDSYVSGNSLEAELSKIMGRSDG
jgi:hypothetical protein